jgi:hypothetical protein
MSRFRVNVIGEPVYLASADRGRLARLGFSAIRVVEAESAEEADKTVRAMVLSQLSRKRPRNPPDQPVALTTQVTPISALESRKYKDAGRGFTFFPHEVN